MESICSHTDEEKWEQTKKNAEKIVMNVISVGNISDAMKLLERKK